MKDARERAEKLVDDWSHNCQHETSTTIKDEFGLHDAITLALEEAYREALSEAAAIASVAGDVVIAAEIRKLGEVTNERLTDYVNEAIDLRDQLTLALSTLEALAPTNELAFNAIRKIKEMK